MKVKREIVTNQQCVQVVNGCFQMNQNQLSLNYCVELLCVCPVIQQK